MSDTGIPPVPLPRRDAWPHDAGQDTGGELGATDRAGR